MKKTVLTLACLALLFGKNFGNNPTPPAAGFTLNHITSMKSGSFSPTDDAPDFWKKKKKKKKKKGSGGGSDKNFQHGGGLTLFYALNNAPDSSFYSPNDAVAYGVSYFPSIQIASLSESLSLRLAGSPTLGISGSFNSQSGSTLSFLFDIPVDAELHFGNQDNDGFGGHVGAGFGYNRISSSDFGGNTAFGPHFTFGLKAFVFGGMYGLRGSFLLNLSKKLDDYGFEGKNVFGISGVKYF